MDNDTIIMNKCKNIVDNNFITKENYDDIVQVNLSLIEDLIMLEPIIWAKHNYEEIIIDEIKDLLFIQYTHLNEIILQSHFDFSTFIHQTIKDALYIYYSFFSPKRSYPNTFIRFIPRENNKEKYISKLKEKVNYLSSVPQPEQRTNEWYVFRHKHLTASSVWKVFSTECSRNQLIYDKCKPIDTSKYKSFSTESPMHWGHKYEPLSIIWYENIFNTKVSDFGCIPHDTIKYIAASPDGINTDPNSPRFGRMIEVKNIVNREITGIPKLEYWIQMQFQMEVCKLNECDFLETRFKEYETIEEFEEDGTFNRTANGKEKGIILYFIKEGQPHYEYAPFMSTREEFIKWEKTIMQKNSELTWMQNLYWRLDEISCILVLRNKLWFNSCLYKLNTFWSIIEREKITGYEHRAPKKKNKLISTPQITVSKCIINDTLHLNNVSKSTVTVNKINDNKINNNKINDNKIINIETQLFNNALQEQYLDDS
jgi:putative phage-type endonuclease